MVPSLFHHYPPPAPTPAMKDSALFYINIMSDLETIQQPPVEILLYDNSHLAVHGYVSTHLATAFLGAVD